MSVVHNNRDSPMDGSFTIATGHFKQHHRVDFVACCAMEREGELNYAPNLPQQ